MKKQVMESLENARANLDQAIAGLEKIPEIDAETVGYTAHKLKNYLAVVGAARVDLGNDRHVRAEGHAQQLARAGDGAAAAQQGEAGVQAVAVDVGHEGRGNLGVEQLTVMLRPLDYEVIPVSFGGCLHLKSCVTEVADGLVLLNPDWVEPTVFTGYRAVTVDPTEPHAANALALGGSVIHPAHFPRTRARLHAEGLRVEPILMAELAKAEAGVTCCSLLVW